MYSSTIGVLALNIPGHSIRPVGLGILLVIVLLAARQLPPTSSAASTSTTVVAALDAHSLSETGSCSA